MIQEKEGGENPRDTKAIDTSHSQTDALPVFKQQLTWKTTPTPTLVFIVA